MIGLGILERGVGSEWPQFIPIIESKDSVNKMVSSTCGKTLTSSAAGTRLSLIT